MYNYKAHVEEVYDGDTFTVMIDLGLDTFTLTKVRLFGVDTPEMRGEDKEFGTKVRDYVRQLILGKDVEISTIKDKKGKYGRWLARVMYPEEVEMEGFQDGDWSNGKKGVKKTIQYKDLATHLLNNKLAKKVDY